MILPPTLSSLVGALVREEYRLYSEEEEADEVVMYPNHSCSTAYFLLSCPAGREPHESRSSANSRGPSGAVNGGGSGAGSSVEPQKPPIFCRVTSCPAQSRTWQASLNF